MQSEAEVGERRGASTCHPFHPLHLWESETALCDMVRSFPAPNKICLFVGSLGQDVVADLTKKARFAENCMNVHKKNGSLINRCTASCCQVEVMNAQIIQSRAMCVSQSVLLVLRPETNRMVFSTFYRNLHTGFNDCR